MHEKRACQSSATAFDGEDRDRRGRTSALRPSRRRCSVSAFSISTCAAIASAWTPASVRPAACTPQALPSCGGSLPRSPAARTAHASCRCQPMNGPPSYSTVRRQRVTRGRCPAESESRAAVPPRVIGARRRAGRQRADRASRAGNRQMRRQATSPACPRTLLRLSACEQLDPLAARLRTTLQGRARRRGPAARSRRPGGSSRSASRPCRSWPRRSRPSLRLRLARRGIAQAIRQAALRQVSPSRP